ncbi:MAG: hypothetical protein AAFN77_00565 [Planctomycetota bacterium]
MDRSTQQSLSSNRSWLILSLFLTAIWLSSPAFGQDVDPETADNQPSVSDAVVGEPETEVQQVPTGEGAEAEVAPPVPEIEGAISTLEPVLLAPAENLMQMGSMPTQIGVPLGSTLPMVDHWTASSMIATCGCEIAVGMAPNCGQPSEICCDVCPATVACCEVECCNSKPRGCLRGLRARLRSRGCLSRRCR